MAPGKETQTWNLSRRGDLVCWKLQAWPWNNWRRVCIACYYGSDHAAVQNNRESGNFQGQNAEVSSWRPEKQIRRWEESCYQPRLYESFWPKPIVRVWLVVSVKMNWANQHVLRWRCWFCGSCTAHLDCKNRCFSVSLGTQTLSKFSPFSDCRKVLLWSPG